MTLNLTAEKHQYRLFRHLFTTVRVRFRICFYKYEFYTLLPTVKKGVIFAKNKIHTEWK